MRVLYLIRVEGLVLCANTSQQCEFVAKSARQRHEYIYRVIFERLDSAHSQPAHDAKDIYAVCSFSDRSNSGGGSSDAAASSS